MLGELPQELVCEVFAHIPAKALVTTVQLVSHPWRELVLDDSGMLPYLFIYLFITLN
jgi:hypothetical protein